MYSFKLVVPAPSAPTITSTIPQATSISLTWTQLPGDVVNSYTISYSFDIKDCMGQSGDTGGDTETGINGSTRIYTLINLPENSVFTISILAVNGAGTSAMLAVSMTNTSTTVAGT